MIPDKIFFRVTLPTLPRPIVDVWLSLVSCLESSNCLPEFFYVSQIAGHSRDLHSEERLKLNTSCIASLIKERALTGFSVDTGHGRKGVSFRLSHMKDCGVQTVFSCTVNKDAKSPVNWLLLIEGIAKQWETIGSWQWGSLYKAWQNYIELKYYEQFFGEKPPNLPTTVEKSECALSPDKELVSTALNPGRHKEILAGIFFLPTAEMWLGPHFWQYAKCTKEEALDADFFLEKRETPHFLYLKSWPQPFSRPDGEQGRLQQRIWQLLFHEDCEWPPGSGGISDEPMYGPPELMP
jgi:hypothetical protein